MSQTPEQTPEAPATDFFKLVITLDPEDNPTLVEFVVTYPKNQGIAALTALHRLPDYAPSLCLTLSEKGDPSIIAAMAEAGIGLDDTDDEGDQS